MLLSAAGKGTISPLVDALPARYTHSDRIQHFATDRSKAILAEGLRNPQDLLVKLGFNDAQVILVDTTDGLRLTLSHGCIIHLRPSGNAPELRCYAEADNMAKAQALVEQVLNHVMLL